MRFPIFIAGLFLAATCLASEAESPPPEESSDTRSGDHIELGLSIGYGNFPLIGLNEADNVADSGRNSFSFDLIIEGRLQHRGVFLELVQGGFENLALGYSVYENEQGNFELIAAKLFGKVDRNNFDQFRFVNDREGDFNLGFRRSRFYGNTMFQTELVGNLTSEHLGFVGTVTLGHQKQFGIWSAHGVVGLRYFSDTVLDQYFGVSDEEINGNFGPHQAHGGTIASIRLGVAYPLSQKFVFKIGLEYDDFPKGIANSPLAQGGSRFDARVGIAYIIGDG